MPCARYVLCDRLRTAWCAAASSVALRERSSCQGHKSQRQDAHCGQQPQPRRRCWCIAGKLKLRERFGRVPLDGSHHSTTLQSLRLWVSDYITWTMGERSSFYCVGRSDVQLCCIKSRKALLGVQNTAFRVSPIDS